jgi:hypothetical protein
MDKGGNDYKKLILELGCEFLRVYICRPLMKLTMRVKKLLSFVLFVTGTTGFIVADVNKDSQKLALKKTAETNSLENKDHSNTFSTPVKYGASFIAIQSK